MAPDLPFGGENSNAIKASSVFSKKEDRLWLPVSAYLIKHPKGKFLVDTGWARKLSPKGEFDKKAQIKFLGSMLLIHLDCDHANGLKQVKGAKKFMVAADEVKFANKITNRVCYYTGTIKYLEQIFTIVPHITAGWQCRILPICSSKYTKDCGKAST